VLPSIHTKNYQEHELRVETRPGHAVIVAVSGWSRRGTKGKRTPLKVIRSLRPLALFSQPPHPPLSLPLHLFPPKKQLISGKAEIFGAELQLGERREVAGGCPFAVFSWKGATVALSAAPPAGSVVVEGIGGGGGASLSSSTPAPPLETAVSLSYLASHTPMPSYLNAHDALEARRTLAAEAAAKEVDGDEEEKGGGEKKEASRRSKNEGPRAIVVGPTNAGKSTISRILLNYAVRAGWHPTFLDLDVGQGALAPPGCLAASPVDAPLAADAPAPDAPLAFYFGSASPADNLELFRFLVSKMASLLNKRSEAASKAARRQQQMVGKATSDATAEKASRIASNKKSVAAGGWVVNWPGWCEGEEALSLLESVVEALSIDTVLVVGDERLHAVLQERLGGRKVGGGAGGGGAGKKRKKGAEENDGGGADDLKISVANLPRSEGAVVRDADTRRAARSAKVKEYFYGPASARPGSPQQLRPAALRLRPNELEVLRIGGAAFGGRPRAPATALPIGHAVANANDSGKAAGNGNGKGSGGSEALRLERREPGPDLVHSLLALSHAKTAEAALSEPVAGFLYVTAVDAHSGAVTVLAPCGGSLPGKVALAGNIKVFLE